MPERKMTIEEIEAAMRRIEGIDARLGEFQKTKEKQKKKPEEVKENVFLKRKRLADEAGR